MSSDGTGMKFPDFKQPGASLRSQRVKKSFKSDNQDNQENSVVQIFIMMK